MFLVTIGATVNAEDINENIYCQLNELKKNDNDIIYEKYKVGDTLFVRCGIKDNILARLTDRKQQEDFKFSISKMLTESIITYWEPKLLRRILRENYFYLNEKERENVFEVAKRLLQEEKTVLPGGFYKISRRNKIMKSILDYFSSDEVLNIDGFVKFRLSTYMKELNETLERAIELYVAEREYNEFIKLLRYFVDIQECKLELVHLLQLSDGRYLLMDKNLNNVNGEYFDEIKNELADENINYDDLLISTLITISPRKIILHGSESFKNKELIKTIKSVFSDRINLCSGCEICRESHIEGHDANKYGL
ncbi:MAG: putative sporulation protein YtxC [Bacillota bacterium]